MKFHAIALKNWKNFAQVEVSIPDRLFLVGPNASGKSNLLDAFRFLRDLASTGGGFQEAVARRGGVTAIRCLAARRQPDIEICVGLKDDDNEWSYEIAFNRDSLQYRQAYGLQQAHTLFRGTIRHTGFCDGWNALVRLGLTDAQFVIPDGENLSYADLVEALLGTYRSAGTLQQQVAQLLSINPGGAVMRQLEWLGLFEHRPIGMRNASPALALEQLLLEKWTLRPDDRDMVIMQHRFEYTLRGKKPAPHRYAHRQRRKCHAHRYGAPGRAARRHLRSANAKRSAHTHRRAYSYRPGDLRAHPRRTGRTRRPIRRGGGVKYAVSSVRGAPGARPSQLLHQAL